MKLHGGIIGVYSEGQSLGSTFYIDIPISNYIQKNGQDLAPIDNTTLNYFESLIMTPRVNQGTNSEIPKPQNKQSQSTGILNNMIKLPRKSMSMSDDEYSKRTEGTMKTSSKSSRFSFIFESIRSSFSSASSRDARGGMKIGIADSNKIAEEYDDLERQSLSIDSTNLFVNQGEIDDESLCSSGAATTSIGPGALARVPHPYSSTSIATSTDQSMSSTREAPSTLTSPSKVQSLPSPATQNARNSSAKSPAAPLNKRVLIVDDAPTNRKLINRLLRDKILHRDEAFDGNDVSNDTPSNFLLIN